MILSDAELLRLMLAGDEDAFSAVYQRHQGSIYRFALLMSGSTNVAEEVVQEVFLAMIREPNRYDPKRGSLSSYLGGIARNHVRRMLRRERPYVELVEQTSEDVGAEFLRMSDEDDPFGTYARNQESKLVRRAVLALPARYREVVVLCDFQECTHADAAAVLGSPVGTIDSRLHRGHALLLKKLRELRRLDSAGENSLRCFA